MTVSRWVGQAILAGIIGALSWKLIDIVVKWHMWESVPWLLIRVVPVLFIFIILLLVITWFWIPSLYVRFSKFLRFFYASNLLRFLFSLVIAGILASSIFLAMGDIRIDTGDATRLYKVFPQAEKYGPSSIEIYATNGSIEYDYHSESPAFGPEEGYFEINFRLWGDSEAHNAGWIIFLLNGVDISRFSELRFLLRGESGQEKIGIKAKDAHGVEVQLILDEHCLRNENLSMTWQQAEVVVPLSYFGNVDFGFFENFSLFTTGPLVGTRPQTIYVGQFELR